MVKNPFKDYFNIDDMVDYFIESKKGSAILLYDRINQLCED